MTTDYRRGFEDGQASARAMADALKGPDRTLYECLGGPKHGERIETGGGMYFRVVLEPDPVRAYPTWRDYDSSYWAIRQGEYKRETISHRGMNRVVYTYQGAR